MGAVMNIDDAKRAVEAAGLGEQLEAAKRAAMASGSWVNQQELAQRMGMDRTVFHRLQKLGLPFKTGGRQKSNIYYFPLVLHWVIGYETLKQRDAANLAADAGFTAALAHLVGTGGDVADAARMLMNGLGIDEHEALTKAAEARGWWLRDRGRIPR